MLGRFRFALLALLLFSTAGIAQMDSLFAGAQFKDGVLRLRWSSGNPKILGQGFRYGYQVQINQQSNQGLHLWKVHPASSQEIMKNISSPADSLCFSIYRNLRSLSFETDENHSAWNMVGLLFGLQENFQLTQSLGMGMEVSGLDTTSNYEIEISLLNVSNAIIPAVLNIDYPWYDPLPKPAQPFGECHDHQVRITGRMSQTANAYASYILEGRKNEESFHRLSDVPMVVNYSLGDPYIYFIDSIGEQDTMQYRFYGKDIWGDTGPFSDTLTILPCNDPKVPAYLISAREIPGRGQIWLQWEFPDSIEYKISGFNLFRSPSRDMEDIQVNNAILPDSTRTYLDRSPGTLNHYWIEVLYDDEDKIESNRVLVSIIDTKPPTTPKGLKATFDTTSFITELHWEHDPDEDLSGYRVYYSDSQTGDKFLLTNRDWPFRSITDTLSRNSLQKERWYWITARDFYGNESNFSPGAEISFPDRYPPIPPHISDISEDYDAIEIKWYGSRSDDVMKHTLLKRSASDSTWLSMELPAQTGMNTFRDTLVQSGDTIYYQIVVTDMNGLTARSSMRTAILLNPIYLPSIPFYHAQNIDSTIVISFDYPEHIEVDHFRLLAGISVAFMNTYHLYQPGEIVLRKGIYKDEDPVSYSLYQIRLVDPKMKKYQFRLGAIEDDNGSISPLTEIFTPVSAN